MYNCCTGYTTLTHINTYTRARSRKQTDRHTFTYNINVYYSHTYKDIKFLFQLKWKINSKLINPSWFVSTLQTFSPQVQGSILRFFKIFRRTRVRGGMCKIEETRSLRSLILGQVSYTRKHFNDAERTSHRCWTPPPPPPPPLSQCPGRVQSKKWLRTRDKETRGSQARWHFCEKRARVRHIHRRSRSHLLERQGRFLPPCPV